MVKGSCSMQDLHLPLSPQKVEELEVGLVVEVVIRDESLPSQRAHELGWIRPRQAVQMEASSLFLESPEKK